MKKRRFTKFIATAIPFLGIATLLLMFIFILVTEIWAGLSLVVFLVPFGYLIHRENKIRDLRESDSALYTARLKKEEKAIYYIFLIFFLFIIFGVMVGSCIGIARAIKEKVFYKKLSNKEVIESIQKSKDEVKNALLSIDYSLATLNDSKNKMDALIANTKTNKEEFLKQINKLNEAEGIAKGMGDKTKEFQKQLSDIQKILGGKGIMTIEEYNKNKIRDLIYAFFIGIITSILGTYIKNLLFKNKKLDMLKEKS